MKIHNFLIKEVPMHWIGVKKIIPYTLSFPLVGNPSSYREIPDEPE